MISQDEILKLIAGEESPIHRNKIAEKLGESSYRPIQTPLDRLTRAGYLNATSDHEYSVTEAGLKKLSEQPLGTKVAEELSEEKLGTTEYQQFISLGKMTGVSPGDLIVQTAKHVWNGGDFKDLDWVARAFQEMGVRKDLAQRWWHSWRSYWRQPIPSEIPAYFGEKGEDAKESKGKKGDKPPRSYILDANNNPVFVGGGLGDLDYEDAKELALAKAAGKARVDLGVSQTPGSMADEMVKLFGAFQQFMGDRSQGKSYMVRQGESGLEVEEVDPGRPMILNYPQGDNKQKPAYLVNQEGEVQEIQPGQPIVIKQPAPPVVAGGVQYLIDRTTGQITQIQPGQPIVIQTQPQQQLPYSPIQMKDKDGNPMVIDLSTLIRLEEHRDKQRRDEESHEVKMEIAKGFKEMLGKASTALGHVAEEK